jgi:histidinol-phosphate phosphatase family protein
LTLKPAVFFDRDGCLTQDSGYTYRLEDLRWVEGAREAVKAVNDAGWLAIVVTNQGGIGLGLYTESHMNAFHDAMQAGLAAIGARIDAFYFSPHHPNAVLPDLRDSDHRRRKPNPGMILDAAADWRIDLAGSVLVGDRETDMIAAARAGVHGIHYTSGRLDDLIRTRLTSLGKWRE